MWLTLHRWSWPLYFEQYQHIPRIRKLTEGLSSTQRSALLETTSFFTNGYTSTPFVCSRAALQTIGVPGITMTWPLAWPSHWKRVPSASVVERSLHLLKPLRTARDARPPNTAVFPVKRKIGNSPLVADNLKSFATISTRTWWHAKSQATSYVLNDIRGRFVSKESERFNEKFGIWHE